MATFLTLRDDLSSVALAKEEGGASPAPGNVEKNTFYVFYMARVRPSGRTGELTSSVNSASALRGKICDFAYVALSLRAGSLRRSGRFAPEPPTGRVPVPGMGVV